MMCLSELCNNELRCSFTLQVFTFSSAVFVFQLIFWGICFVFFYKQYRRWSFNDRTRRGKLLWIHAQVSQIHDTPLWRWYSEEGRTWAGAIRYWGMQMKVIYWNRDLSSLQDSIWVQKERWKIIGSYIWKGFWIWIELSCITNMCLLSYFSESKMKKEA